VHAPWATVVRRVSREWLYRRPGSMRAAKYEGKSHEPDDVLKYLPFSAPAIQTELN